MLITFNGKRTARCQQSANLSCVSLVKRFSTNEHLRLNCTILIAITLIKHSYPGKGIFPWTPPPNSLKGEHVLADQHLFNLPATSLSATL